jgi:hypothetical protein
MKLYMFEVNGLYLASMRECDPNEIRSLYGAFDLKTQGDYYDTPIVAFNLDANDYLLGAKGWLLWLKGALKNNFARISDEFPFDTNDVKIVEFTKRED